MYVGSRDGDGGCEVCVPEGLLDPDPGGEISEPCLASVACRWLAVTSGPQVKEAKYKDPSSPQRSICLNEAVLYD